MFAGRVGDRVAGAVRRCRAVPGDVGLDHPRWAPAQVEPAAAGEVERGEEDDAAGEFEYTLHARQGHVRQALALVAHGRGDADVRAERAHVRVGLVESAPDGLRLGTADGGEHPGGVPQFQRNRLEAGVGLEDAVVRGRTRGHAAGRVVARAIARYSASVAASGRSITERACPAHARLGNRFRPVRTRSAAPLEAPPHHAPWPGRCRPPAHPTDAASIRVGVPGDPAGGVVGRRAGRSRPVAAPARDRPAPSAATGTKPSAKAAGEA